MWSYNKYAMFWSLYHTDTTFEGQSRAKYIVLINIDNNITLYDHHNQINGDNYSILLCERVQVVLGDEGT